MFTINGMYGTIAEVGKELLDGNYITNYVDVDNGVMYHRENCNPQRIPVWQVLYDTDGKPKVFPKLEELQDLFEKKFKMKVNELYD